MGVQARCTWAVAVNHAKSPSMAGRYGGNLSVRLSKRGVIRDGINVMGRAGFGLLRMAGPSPYHGVFLWAPPLWRKAGRCLAQTQSERVFASVQKLSRKAQGARFRVAASVGP